jgi:membrane associated rhomboid family serine protease
MKWDSVGRKLAPLAIENITVYIACLQSLCFIFQQVKPNFFDSLILDPHLVMQGEVWRLVTCALLPTSGNIVFLFFELMFFIIFGTALEREWGALRYNLYLLIGYLASVAAVFAVGTSASVGTTVYFETSVFLAFAWLYPDYIIQLFFIIPCKVKWLAWLTWAFYGFKFISGGHQQQALVLASVANFLLFMGRDILVYLKFIPAIPRGKKKAAVVEAFHRCALCGVTDQSNRKMEFRYCPDCAGTPCYCIDHIENHVHRTQPAEAENVRS